MALLRKYYAWFIIGLVLLAELVALFFVFANKGAAQEARVRLEGRRTRRDELKRLTKDVDARIKVFNKRKEYVRGELGDCALYLWHAGQAIEGLFDAKELEPYDVKPWVSKSNVRDFAVFRVEYQTVYNRETAKLLPLMQKLETDPGALNLAAPSGLAQAHIEVGDIFALQKEFWVRKRLLEALSRFDAKLDLFTGPAPSAAAHHLPPGKAADAPTGLANSIQLRLKVSCDYTDLSELIEELLRSPLCIHLRAIASVVKNPLPGLAPGASGETPATPARGGRGEGVIGSGLPPRKFVAADLTIDIPDINVELREVIFPSATFPDKARLVPWIDGQIRDLDRRLKRLDAAREEPAAVKGAQGARKPDLSYPWLARALEAIEKAEPGKPVTLTDELAGRRQYSFESPEAARNWIVHRGDYERVKLEARLALWRRVRRVAAARELHPITKIGVNTTPEGFAVVCRPPEQFHGEPVYSVPFGDGVEARLGHVSFKPIESREGVQRAASVRR